MGSVLDKNSSLVRKRIENHTFEGEDGEEYEGSEFHGFGDYFRRKKIKLQNLDADMRVASDKPQIFKGIVAHVTGYTQPPLHILHREIVQHGGGFLQYLDSKTMATHIIASTLPPKKSVDFGRYRIVKPAWVVDSVQAGKLMPWADYRVLDDGPRQKVLKFDGGKGLTQASPQARQGYREQTDSSFYTSQMRAAAASLPSQDLSQVAEKLQTPGRSQALKRVIDLQDAPGSDSNPCFTNSITAQELSTTGDGIAAIQAPAIASPPPGPQPDDETPAEATLVAGPLKNMTSEEHNAWLLSDPRLRKSSTANPEFLKQFYSESRLHHLSTWKAGLKSSMQRLAAEKGLSQKKFKKRPGARAYIMHVDFDSFFCAVSLKRHPEYVDKPTVVAHSTGSGSEIASCNYPARKFGVKNGMWMKRALELCPDLRVLPYDFPAYEEASRLFYESILSVGGVVQSVSVDEALIDATAVVLSSSGSQGMDVDEGNVWREQEKADEIAHALREKIKAKTGCAVSVGIGGNVLQAKVGLRKAKPAGQFQLKPEQVLDVIGELEVEDLPGVSYSIGGKLEELGIRFVKDIRDVSRERLASALGPKTGEKLADYSRGIDRTEVGEQPPRKSVSAEVNWGIRFISQQEAEEFVYDLCKELEKRLLSEQVKGKHLTMKMMRRSLDAPLDPAKHLGHGKCDTFNKSATFGVATHNFEAIGKEAVSILRSFKFSPGDLRGLGVQMTKLEPIKGNAYAPEGGQRTLPFTAFSGPSSSKKQTMAEPIDDIESPQKRRSSEGLDIGKDPIADDPLTPRKPKIHPAMALSRAGQDDAKSNTPLNVSGTQFIIPSNPDPAVLAELPSDIRSKLMGQRTKPSPAREMSQPASPVPAEALPSQVDAEVFNALPDDMKAEVLAMYGRSVQPAPQLSPRRDHLAPPRRQTTPTKRGGIRGLFGKAQRQRDSQAGVMQTNFKALKRADEAPVEDEVEELDPEFLAELPEDVRKEVIADHRRRRMALRSGLDAPARRHFTPDTETILPGGQRRIQFPASPRKVSFASSGVTSTREIKDMLDAWHSETQHEGPHRGDVQVLEKYLTQVVLEERDLEKVVVMVKWLNIIVEQDGEDGKGRESWRTALDQVKEAVQGAVRQRGLAPLDM
ncbi:DNA repair protein REV1 [Tolypocladium paradoxum]|uniref:DNA repair protein REV1 n=1 Tax=Tolypocladium paradoxum TaxID=94208 RepID=A0A2S4LAL1_9HYPO|nr:DNA repair protein REV1 [Tolypocladium paradoxum]